MRTVELETLSNGTKKILVGGRPLTVGWNVPPSHLDALVVHHGLDIAEELRHALKHELALPCHGLDQDEQNEIMRLLGLELDMFRSK